MEVLYIVIAVVFVLLIILGIMYNGLVIARNKVRNQFAQIDVQLKNRFDLIPDILESAKRYMQHEQETLEGVVAARNHYMSAEGNIGEAIDANNQLTGALNKLFAVAESYPDLKAEAGFADFRQKLTDVEERIRFARQFFNDAVTAYNNKIQVVPTNIVAAMFGFKEEKLFEVDEVEREKQKLNFE